ncbi:SE1561 family protein [Sporolactobacillus pectinivorans]|uniref:SE1561 family protein n=1 Tax=Sporolactobacillus pectinivorans TaxID=1591408 RepID=UPI000C260068|nr:SE1561 family protein [Sporolactobacillus pectinivorans]
MGRATDSKSDQVAYLKNRIRLLSYMINALESDSAGPEDLNKLLGMLDDLEIKVKRFCDDWEEGLGTK